MLRRAIQFRSLVALALLACVGGCGTRLQSFVDPAGHQARQINSLYWFHVYVNSAIYGLVILFALIAILKRRSANAAAPSERRAQNVVGGLIGVTVIVLFVFLIADFVVSRSVRGMSGENPVIIKVIGHQWWWEIRYEDGTPSNIVSTSNEIHIPTNRPVQFILGSNDVIHSFWIPNLQGKKDLIPGHPTTHWLSADREGTYYGQCAEFCGAQHANMRIAVTVESQRAFDAWLDASRASAREPTNPSQARGKQVFMSSTCNMCHTISGTDANGRVGPELTHIASRDMLAANSIPNVRGYLCGWILDPQHIKPGARMPQQGQLSATDLEALLDYLESLK